MGIAAVLVHRHDRRVVMQATLPELPAHELLKGVLGHGALVRHRAGDLVEVEVEGLGTLAQTVQPEVELF